MSIKLHEGYKPIHLQNTECNKHHSKECPWDILETEDVEGLQTSRCNVSHSHKQKSLAVK